MTTAAPVVYRVYDATHRLIYIGSTVDLKARMGVHRYQSWWSPLLAHVETEMFPDLASARVAEVGAIRCEQPAFNMQHSPNLTAARLELTATELDVCREWLSQSPARASFIPLPLRWVRDEPAIAELTR